MNQPETSNRRRVVILFLVSTLMLCLVTGIMGRAPRFHGRKQFLPYTRNLHAVDKVELFKLELKDDHWDGQVTASKVLRGAAAQRVASLWRRQTYTSNLSACHEPAYAIKFYSRGKLIAYASVCWSCNSIFFITPNLQRTQSFDGGDKRGEELSEVFRLAFIE
jgi:hypothetical protein